MTNTERKLVRFTMHVLLSDLYYATNMDVDSDRSGLTMYNALDQKPTSAIVLTTVGAYTTVYTAKTCPSYAPRSHALTESTPSSCPFECPH